MKIFFSLSWQCIFGFYFFIILLIICVWLCVFQWNKKKYNFWWFYFERNVCCLFLIMTNTEHLWGTAPSSKVFLWFSLLILMIFVAIFRWFWFWGIGMEDGKVKVVFRNGVFGTPIGWWIIWIWGRDVCFFLTLIFNF